MSTDKELADLVATNELVGAIHDAIFDAHTKGKAINIAGIIDDLCCWVAELHLQNEALEATVQRAVSAGFLRRDTSNLTQLHPAIKTNTPAVDDEWIITGKEARQ